MTELTQAQAAGPGPDPARPLTGPLQALSFPLNVYAAFLEWAEGRCDCLHYGLFDGPDDPIWQAQARASQSLWAALPAPPTRVLEVGIGLGQTLARLRDAGYQATGLTPEPAQIEAARASHGQDLAIDLGRLEDYAGTGQGFELMLFQESAQYIGLLDLFESANRLLVPQGATLVVMDEFALKREGEGDFGLHLLPHFKALARRFGWQLQAELDFSAAAKHTVDVLLALTRRYALRLQSELDVTAQAVHELELALLRYQRNYQQGIYGYALLRLHRSQLPKRRPVPLRPQTSGQMRSLFERVFKRPMTDEEWQWKYGQGRGQGIGLEDAQGRMVAFYGGLTRPVLLAGRPRQASQICDVMVAGDGHDSLVRHGALHQVAATFLEQQMGWARPHAVGFGFPTERALKVGERLGLYQRVDELVQLSWPPGLAEGAAEMTADRTADRAADRAAETATQTATQSAAEPATAPARVIKQAAAWSAQPLDLRAMQPGDAAWLACDKLWQTMATSFADSALPVRDPAWLQHRYGHKPTASCQAQTLRDPQEQLKGLVVYRCHADHLELLDVVAAAADIQPLLRAWRQLLRTADAAGDPASQGLPVRAWITASHAHLLQDEAALSEPLNLFVPANVHSPGVGPAALMHKWFLMAGDTDFR